MRLKTVTPSDQERAPKWISVVLLETATPPGSHLSPAARVRLVVLVPAEIDPRYSHESPPPPHSEVIWAISIEAVYI